MTWLIVIGLVLEVLGLVAAWRGMMTSVTRYDGSRDTRWEAGGLLLIGLGTVCQLGALLLG